MGKFKDSAYNSDFIKVLSQYQGCEENINSIFLAAKYITNNSAPKSKRIYSKFYDCTTCITKYWKYPLGSVEFRFIFVRVIH